MYQVSSGLLDKFSSFFELLEHKYNRLIIKFDAFIVIIWTISRKTSWKTLLDSEEVTTS